MGYFVFLKWYDGILCVDDIMGYEWDKQPFVAVSQKKSHAPFFQFHLELQNINIHKRWKSSGTVPYVQPNFTPPRPSIHLQKSYVQKGSSHWKLASLIPSAIHVETTQTFLDGCTLLTPPDCRIPSMVFLPTEAERILWLPQTLHLVDILVEKGLNLRHSVSAIYGHIAWGKATTIMGNHTFSWSS